MTTSYSRLTALAAALSELGGDLAVKRGQWRRTHGTMSTFEAKMFNAVESNIIDIIIHIHNEIDKLEIAEGAARES